MDAVIKKRGRKKETDPIKAACILLDERNTSPEERSPNYKEALRKLIEAQIQEFKARGGSIKQIPPGVMTTSENPISKKSIVWKDHLKQEETA
ncbi:hypothetical protein [Endozoicomonas sp. SESOKO3]|uniref:hypothetical protein n=1 Tax=Endozoicomonas sp. SESOKO3 TaxID=2828744 RepID=UPI002147C270|nr:hypothetical protein [Endozoicomonas sp. SESOKO3]